MTSSRVIPNLHKYIGVRRTGVCVGRIGLGLPACSDNWLLSELLFALFGLAAGWGWPVFIVKSFWPRM